MSCRGFLDEVRSWLDASATALSPLTLFFPHPPLSYGSLGIQALHRSTSGWSPGQRAAVLRVPSRVRGGGEYLDVHGGMVCWNTSGLAHHIAVSVPVPVTFWTSRSWYALHPVDPVHPSDRDPLSTIDAQILFDRLLQPILRINSYQTENRMIYGTLVCFFVYVCMAY